MSRSCHSATSQSRLARCRAPLAPGPLICSLVTGFRLCGMADEPFCFSLKNSSTSRTSVRLQVTDFGCNLIQRGGDHGEGGEIVRVPVTLDYLRRYGGRLQTQTRADLSSISGVRCAKIPTAPENFANSQILGHRAKARNVALCFGIPIGDLEAKG